MPSHADHKNNPRRRSAAISSCKIVMFQHRWGKTSKHRVNVSYTTNSSQNQRILFIRQKHNKKGLFQATENTFCLQLICNEAAEFDHYYLRISTWTSE